MYLCPKKKRYYQLHYFKEMDLFIEFARQTSNFQDFRQIFDSQAKFKPQKPPEAICKQYMIQSFSKIMTDFMTYLLKTEEFTGKTEKQIAQQTKSGEIDQTDLIMHFNSWLSLEQTVFILPEQKPKPSPKPLPVKPSEQLPQRTPTTPKPHIGGKQEGRKEGHPFDIQKLQPEPKIVQPIKSNYPTIPGVHNQNQKMRQNQNVYSLQQHYTPIHQPQDDKPFRLRFYQKIAEYFQYPQRASTIKSDLNSLFIPGKKG